jgi:radical SAM superfamily enzyme YgiQ (UPF0313 family)
MFTSDNFNKYADAPALLQAMIDEKIGLPFFVQCDVQIAKQESFVALLARAGCFQMFVGVESFNRRTLLAAHKAQNHPQVYGEIVRLCREVGIICHFSNIIGFPEDTAEGIEEHLHELIRLSPDIASFYILTPVPGTQQYDEFRLNGRIFEANLDRFDGTCPVYTHDFLEAAQLRDTLFECYRRFYSVAHLARFCIRNRKAAFTRGVTPHMGLPFFSRYAASRRMHPMSGGVGRVVRDGNEEFRELRRKRFGFDLVPLPGCLTLSADDLLLNSRARIS